jgi:F0F1-type ATP synthase membrane subunit b/b'
MGAFFESFIEAVKTFGWERALFTVFFFGMHYVVYKLYLGRLQDRQREIERLREENNDYKERFIAVLDKEMDFQLEAPSDQLEESSDSSSGQDEEA